MRIDDPTKLTKLYFKDNISNNINWMKKVNSEIEEMLNLGYPYNLLEKAIHKDPNNYIETTKKLSKQNPQNTSNLIEEDIFYYHPQLQVAPMPPVIRINPDGTFTEDEEEFYLKIKQYYTLESATKYFFSRFQEIPNNEKKDLGGMNYVYNSTMKPWVVKMDHPLINPLDLLLFTIDAARAATYDDDKRLTNILSLADYVEEGMYIYKEKMHYAILNGINKVC